MKILMKNICQFSKGVEQKYRDIKNINNDKKKCIIGILVKIIAF